MLAAGMAQGAITYTLVNQVIGTGDSGYMLDLNSDGQADFKLFFDNNNSTKPCVLGTSNGSVFTPFVFNEMNMSAIGNGTPVIGFGTNITTQFAVGTNTVAIATDQKGKNEAYLYQNGENQTVGQWPAGQDTFGYVGLALVNTTVTPATTNYGWVQLELNYTVASPTLKIIDYAYQDIAGSNILAGQEGPIDIPAIYFDQGYPSPTNQTVAAGVTVKMNVVAMADPAATYQWMAGAVGSGVYTNLPNGGAFSGANTPNLTVSNVTPGNQLDYVVAVANSNGSVTSSPPATLTVIAIGLSGPVPDQQFIYAGYPAQFTVTDIGGVTATNTWQRNGASLVNGGAYSGVNTTTLLISSVNPTNLGNYTAIASTAYGATNSSMAPLGIVYPDGSLYESNVLAFGAVDYYRLDETSGTNAWDFIGGNNGTYGSDAVLGASGPNPAAGFLGFESTNYAATFAYNDPNNLLPVLPWNLNTNAVTFTAWIYPTINEGNGGIVFTVGTNNMVCGLRYDGGYLNTNGISDGNIGYLWNDDFGNTGLWNSGITAPHNQWSLVALAVAPTSATLYIINANGVQSATNPVSHAVQAFNATEYIGTYPLEGNLGVNNFIGNIDELAIFKSALSSYQVQALYDYAAGIQPPPPPPSPITISKVGNIVMLQWTSGTLLQATNLLGPWITNAAAASPYILSPTNAQQFFRTQ